MKKLLILTVILLFIISCSEEDDKPRQKFSTEITGIAALGNLTVGSVSAFNFSSCSPGEKLATAELADSNHFNLKFDTAKTDLPVLLELTNFSYVEESSQANVVEIEKPLYASFILQSGQSQNTSISYWTNLAHARTTFLCNENASQVSQHIAQSNDEVSATLLFDIIKTQPQQLGSGPIIFTKLETISYGVVNAAISFYTSSLDRKAGGTGEHTSFTSIDLATIAFEDLMSDNILDGVGINGEPISVGETMISADTYRTELANDIYYALAVYDISPKSRLDEISIIAKSINISDKFDVFPDMTVTPLSEETTPSIIGTSYYACPRYDSCTPTVGCNVCFTIEGDDRYVPCEITMFLDIKDKRGIPFTVTGEVLGSDAFEKFQQVNVSGHPEPTFHIKFPYNATNDPVGNQRDIRFVATNKFGLSQAFTVNAHARVPIEGEAVGAWYKQPYICNVSVTSIEGN